MCCRFVRIVVRLRIRQCTCYCFEPSLAAERTSLFEWLGLDVLDRTYGSIVRAAMCSTACWTAFADFCEAVMRKKERAEWERQALERQRTLLARASLRSNDMCKNVYIMYIFRIVFNII